MDYEYVTYLKRGDVVLLEGIEHVVTHVNDCRATCVPLSKKQVDYETTGGKRIKFETNHRSCGICPDSPLDKLRRLSEQQLIALGHPQRKQIEVTRP